MGRPRFSALRAVFVLLLAGLPGIAPLCARGQFATLLDTTSRYAGLSTGAGGYSTDTGFPATATELYVPTYFVMDSHGNLYISDKQNNCVRKVDTSGNITTVAGLRQSGQPDTCQSALNSSPAPITSTPGVGAQQGLFAPTGLAIDSNNKLYIADSQHNCVLSLAYGVADSYASPALNVVAGTCTLSNTMSNTPAPDGLAVDGSLNLYISIVDSGIATPAYQVVRHAPADPTTTICAVAGTTSSYAATAMCSGVSNTITVGGVATPVELDRPAGLAFDTNGNLFIADSYNDCVREVVGMTTQATVVGQCNIDLSGSTSTSLSNPYGLGFSADGSLYISESGTGHNNVVSYNFGTGTLTAVAGLASGASVPAYSSSEDGESALLVALNQPLGVTTDAGGNLYLADSQNNIVRYLGNNVHFPDTIVNQFSTPQTLVFSINQAVNLTYTIGSDFTIVSSTCTGSLSSGGTCQVVIKFHPSRPGYRNSYVRLIDSISGTTVTVSLEGKGIGPLSLLTPGVASMRGGGLRNAVAVTTDAAGDAYVLEQGDFSTTADVLFYPAAGGAAQVKVAQGKILGNPNAIAVDGAGNIYVAITASGIGGSTSIARFGVDGSTNLSYATGLLYVTSMTIDELGDLYVAMAGSAHNVTEVYAGGQQRVVMGNGANTPANGGIASAASLYDPSAVAYGPNGLIIADAGTHYVYTIDNLGIIHIVAGNGTTTTTNASQATGTGLNMPEGLAVDAAGDIYISDDLAERIYEVYSGSGNASTIATIFGTGTTAYTGDGGFSTLATLSAPMALALDGSSDLFVVDSGNSALREVTYPVTNTINFGNQEDGVTSAPVYQYLINAGNSGLTFNPVPNSSPLFTPVTASNVVVSQYAVSSTTCSGTVGVGDICDIGYTVTPTSAGLVSAQSNLASNSYNTQQTIFFNATGYAGNQSLPFVLANPEIEVYGNPFLQSLTLTLVAPFIDPTGSMAFSVPAFSLTTCTLAGPFASGVVTCDAPNSGLNVNSYTVDYTYTSGDTNYVSTTGTTTLNVTPAPLTVTCNSYSRAYGAINPANFGYTISGLVNGDTVGTTINVTCSTTATSSSAPNTYAITPSISGSHSGDYTVTLNSGTLTVGSATTPLIITIGNASRAYGTSNPAFTFTVSGAVNGDTFNVAYTTSATISSPVGTYAIGGTVSGANLSNYSNVQVVDGTLTITPVSLSVTCGSANRQYGVANPVFGNLPPVGLVGSDTVTVSCSTTATIASPVGSYPITPSISGALAGNYTLNPTNGTLIIFAAPAATITVNNASRAYGVANPTFSYSNTSGILNGDTFILNYSTPATIASPVGNYSISGTIVGGSSVSNYVSVTVVSGTLTITPSLTPLVFAVNNSTRPYYTANPTFASTVTGAVNGDSFTLSYATAAVLTSPVGPYSVTNTVSGGSSLSNYAIVQYVPGTLTITAATTPLIVTCNSYSRSYDTANPILGYTTSGLLGTDSVTVTCSTVATIASPVSGSPYAITPTVSGAAAANYTVQSVPGTLTITASTTPLVVTVNNATRAYGVGNPAFGSVITGALNGDTFTINYSTTATIASPVGNYPINAVVSGAAAANYSTITVNPGTLAITASTTPLVVTVNNATRAYGVGNPAFGSVITGALNGDTFTINYSTTATIASPVGNYPINAVVSGAAAANYSSITVNPGTLTITQALTPLTITVNSVSRSYGVANPAFTSTVTGALNGDTFTETYTNAATAASPVGGYPISATVAGTNIADYATVNIVPGTLTITPDPTTTTVVTSGSPAIQGANITFTATVTSALGAVPTATVNFYNGATLLGTGTLNASGQASFSTSALTAGSYTITATYQASVDYTSSSGTVPQVITPGTFTIVATPLSQFIRGAGVTVYEVTVNSVQGFEGPVTLTCAGLPADSNCTFATQTVSLSIGGTATTTMTVSTTEADARLQIPTVGAPTHSRPGGFSPIAFAAAFPFGLGAFFAGLVRRKRGRQQGKKKFNRAPRIRLLVAVLCTAGIIGVVGCACHTSIYQMYTIPVTGTTSVSGVSAQTTGTAPNSASPTLTVAESQQ